MKMLFSEAYRGESEMDIKRTKWEQNSSFSLFLIDTGIHFIPVTPASVYLLWILWNLSFRYISGKKNPNDAVTPQRQSLFTPKMNAMEWQVSWNSCYNKQQDNHLLMLKEDRINLSFAYVFGRYRIYLPPDKALVQIQFASRR